MNERKVDSFNYFDGLTSAASLWADRLNYSGGLTYRKPESIYRPEGLLVRDSFEYITLNGFKTEDGEQAGKYSTVHYDFKRFYPENSRMSAKELDGLYDIGGIRLTSDRDNVTVSVEVSDEGVLYFPVARMTLSAGKPETAEIFEPSRKFIRLVMWPENAEDEYIFYPHEIMSAELYAAKSPRQELPENGLTDAGITCPALYPEPFSADGHEELIPLSGVWKMTDYPEQKYWETGSCVDGWLDIPVPGDPDHHGSDVYERSVNSEDSSGAAVVFRQTVAIPEGMAGKRIIMRFESVIAYARVFVNGCFVRSHRSAMTPFDCDITDFVKAGCDAEVTLYILLENRKPDFMMIRGIGGYVWLFALPEVTLSAERLSVTLKDGSGILTVRSKLSGGKPVSITHSLFDPDGAETPMTCTETRELADGSTERCYLVEKPVLWSSETPVLYTLKTSLENGFLTIKKTGFRSIEVRGNRLLVNGNEERLHGVNWMSHSAFEGLASAYESDRDSLIKFKAANVNYIRTSHNPQRAYVHELCDELGIYIEEEMSTVFLSRWVPNNYERFDYLVNPKYLPVFLEGYAEMAENSASNISVLYYSLGNESDWSDNVLEASKLLRAIDPVRPQKFSWGYSVPEGILEILSEHYTPSQWMGAVSESPVVYDEHTHTLGENLEKIESDPGHRDVYDHNIKRIYEAFYNKPGGLGLAIWNGREFAAIRNGEHGALFSPKWGELDLWNRPKPEFWHMRKVFSPVHIDETENFRIPSHGSRLQIPVQNRYSQLNFRSLSLYCAVNGEQINVPLPELEPGEKGYITIKRDNWQKGDKVELYFSRPDDPLGNTLTDQFEFNVERAAPELPFKTSGETAAPVLYETQVESQINEPDIHYHFARYSALFYGGYYQKKLIIKDGPYLNLGANFPLTYESTDMIAELKQCPDCVTYTSVQHYKELEKPVKMVQRFLAGGRIEITYSFTFPESHSIDEAGVVIHLVNTDRVIWEKRTGIFSSYPVEHVGRTKGDIRMRRKDGVEEKLREPEWSWCDDECEFQLRDKGSFMCTRDFRASKRNYYYAAALREDGIGIAALSDGGDGSVRFNRSGDDILMNINTMCGSITLNEFGANNDELRVKSGEYTGTVKLQFVEL